MSSQREDYLIRLLTQAAAALRRLRERLAGGAAAGEIVREAEAAEGELLGRDAVMLRALDPATAAGLLGDPRRAALWGELLLVEATAQRQLGQAERAAALEARAKVLLRAAGPAKR
jgi:hypothetical protein